MQCPVIRMAQLRETTKRITKPRRQPAETRGSVWVCDYATWFGFRGRKDHSYVSCLLLRREWSGSSACPHGGDCSDYVLLVVAPCSLVG
jgi:hypothetical protein